MTERPYPLTQPGKGAHNQIHILILQLLDDVDVSFLRSGHACVAKASGHTCNRDTGEQKQRGVGVPQPMNRNDRDVEALTVAGQNVIDGGVEYPLLCHKDRLIFRETLYQFGELNNRLPVNLDLTNRGGVFRRQEAPISFVIPSLADGERLVRKIKILGRDCQCLRKTHTSFGNQQNQPVPADVSPQIQVDEQRVEFKLIQIFDLLLGGRLAFNNRLARGVPLNQACCAA